MLAHLDCKLLEGFKGVQSIQSRGFLVFGLQDARNPLQGGLWQLALFMLASMPFASASCRHSCLTSLRV